jgi:NADH-quinone oxidoreductase subunit C
MDEEDKPKQPLEPESQEAQTTESEDSEAPKPSEPSPKSAEPEKPAKPTPPTAAKDKPKQKPPKSAPPKPAKKKVLSYEDLEDDVLLQKLKEQFSDGLLSGQSFLEQPTYTVSMECFSDLMVYLRDNPEWDFDYLIDVTALDYLGDEKRFCMVYHLYSHQHEKLIRIKARISEEEVVPSVSSIWKAGDWMEREVYDLFGIEFSGHDNLSRILLPDDWHGHPLRKDYDIKLQDQAWIKKHLHITKTPP